MLHSVEHCFQNWHCRIEIFLSPSFLRWNHLAFELHYIVRQVGLKALIGLKGNALQQLFRSQSSRSKRFCFMLPMDNILSLPFSLMLHGVRLHLSMMLCLALVASAILGSVAGLELLWAALALWMQTHCIAQHVNAVHLASVGQGALLQDALWGEKIHLPLGYRYVHHNSSPCLICELL